MRVRLGSVGVVGLGGLVVGLLLLFLASGPASAVGLIVAILAVVFLVADRLPAGLLGGFLFGGVRARDRRPDPAPEYIERAGEPSEQLWREEQARYRDRDADR